VTTIVITPAIDYSTDEETYTVTATRDEPRMEVKSCLWRTIAAALSIPNWNDYHANGASDVITALRECAAELRCKEGA
jgi:hypothetical protein